MFAENECSIETDAFACALIKCNALELLMSHVLGSKHHKAIIIVILHMSGSVWTRLAFRRCSRCNNKFCYAKTRKQHIRQCLNKPVSK